MKKTISICMVLIFALAATAYALPPLPRTASGTDSRLTSCSASGMSPLWDGTIFACTSGTGFAYYNAGVLSYLTGASARSALGLAIGTDVQAYSANLATYAGIAPSANVQTLLGSADYAAFVSSLGLTIGTNTQAYNARLASIAAATETAPCMWGTNAAGTFGCYQSVSWDSNTYFFDVTQGTTNPKKLIFSLSGMTANKTVTLASTATDDRTVTLPDATATLTYNVANSTALLGTSEIPSGQCATVVSVSGTGIATTDVIDWGFNADPTSTTGYSATANGMLTIIAYPTSGYANFKVCNNTSGAITPEAVVLNWRVRR